MGKTNKITAREVIEMIMDTTGLPESTIRKVLEATRDAMEKAIDEGRDIFIPRIGPFKYFHKDASIRKNVFGRDSVRVLEREGLKYRRVRINKDN